GRIKLFRLLQPARPDDFGTFPIACSHCARDSFGIAWNCFISQARDPATVRPWSKTSRTIGSSLAARKSLTVYSTKRASFPVHLVTVEASSPTWRDQTRS